MSTCPSISARYRWSWAGLSFLQVLWLCACQCSTKPVLNNHLEANAMDDMSHERVNNDIAKYLPDVCRDHHGKAFPTIYAHSFEQSLSEGSLLEDIVANNTGRIECAPGPFSFDRDANIDDPAKRWNLLAAPNYFVLQNLDGNKYSDESFYLASQNNFPIHCQYYRLQQNDSATLVLIPRTKMEPGQVYFLYLILTEGDSRRTWIQPLTASKQA